MLEKIMRHWQCAAIATGALWGVIAIMLYGRGFKWTSAKDFFVDLQQFLFNAVGGVAGWVCLRLLYDRRGTAFGWPEIALLLIGLLGVSGKLSAVIWELPNALKEKLSGVVRTARKDQ